MTDLVALTEYLVKRLVANPDSISVREINENDATTIQVLVLESDMSKLIGKGGCIANSIRTIIQASAYINNLGRVYINIDSMENN